jgi:hypothetical protein
MMVVPRLGAVRISKVPFSFFTLAVMLENPNSSLLAARESAMPDPLSVTSKTRLGGSDRRLTLMTVGLAWRTALLIAS